MAPETLGGRDRLRLFAARHGQYGRRDRRRVELEHAFVRDQLGRAMRDDEVRRHARDGHAACGQHDAVRIARPGVGDFAVKRLPAGVELPELLLVLRERPVAAAHALPRRLDVDLDQDRRRACAQRLANRWRLDSAAAESDHARRHRQRFERDPLLDLAEDALLEQLRNRSFSLLDPRVHIEKRPVQPLRNLLAECRLAGAHEAD